MPGCILVRQFLMLCMKKAGFVAQVENPLTGEMTESVGSAFVDDANMYVFGRHLNSMENCTRKQWHISLPGLQC